MQLRADQRAAAVPRDLLLRRRGTRRRAPSRDSARSDAAPRARRTRRCDRRSSARRCDCSGSRSSSSRSRQDRRRSSGLRLRRGSTHRCRPRGRSSSRRARGPAALMRWIGFLPTTPSTSPPRPRNRMRWPTSTCGSHPPIGDGIDEAVVVDVLHDDADLVDVAVEHDRRRAARIDLGHAVARDVGRDTLGEGRRLFAPDARGGPFEARRSGRVEQALEERQRARAQHVIVGVRFDGIQEMCCPPWRDGSQRGRSRAPSALREEHAATRSQSGLRMGNARKLRPRITRPATYQRRSSVSP